MYISEIELSDEERISANNLIIVILLARGDRH